MGDWMSYLTLKAGAAFMTTALITAGFPAAAARDSIETASGNASQPGQFSQAADAKPVIVLHGSRADVVPPPLAFAPPGPETRQGTNTLLSVANAGVQASHGELDALRAYRITQDRNAPQSNLWGHYLSNSSRIITSSGASYRFEQHGMTLGADTRTILGSGELVAGAFITYADNGIRHAGGGTSRNDSYGFGVYAGWTDIGGAYLDAVLKGNRLDNSLSARGAGLSGEWQQFGLSTALEAGYRLMPLESLWVEPYARVTGIWLDDASTTLSNGITAQIGSTRSATMEGGAKLGTHFVFDDAEIKPYLRAGAEQTFASTRAVAINNSERVDSDTDGTLWKYAAGTSVNFGGNTSLYGEVNYRHGSHVASPLQGIAGVRVSF